MDKIKMLCGQMGPDIDRAAGQELIVGVDVDAEEAQRLVGGDLAIELLEPAPAPVPVPTPAPAAASVPTPAPAPREPRAAKKPAKQA